MGNEQWRFKRYYFLTSFAVIFLITVGMGLYFIKGKYSEFQKYALSDKMANIDNKKTILKNIVNSFINQAEFRIMRMELDLDQRLQSRVSTAFNIAGKINSDMGTHYNKDEIEAGIKSAVSSMVFGDNYVFIINTKGGIILSPKTPSHNGAYIISSNKAEERKSINRMLTVVNDGGKGFVDMYERGVGPDKNSFRHKRVYVELFKPFGWIIGYGEYMGEYENELKAEVIRNLDTVTYENGGYLFASNDKGVSLTRPVKGKNMYDVQDVNGKYIVRELLKKAREGGGFVAYVMPPFKGARPETKLSYVAPIPQWGWYVGAGMYLTDIEAAYNKRLNMLYRSARREVIFVVMALSLLLVIGGLAVFIFSGKLQDLIDSYSDEINSKNDELSELNLSLEEKVMEKTAELNQLNQSLEMRVREEVEKNREKDRIMFQQGRLAAMGEMIGNIAHQWRQPLSSISLLVQDIQEAYECGELNEDYLEDTVGKCTGTIGHMSDTIDNFRYFFNPDKKVVRFNISDEIKKSLNLLDAGLENNNIKITVNMETDAEAFGVPGEYAQVLVNIINNARDILLSRNTADPEIRIECRGAGETAEVRICDNAGGVEPSIMDKIFEPYFTTKNQSKGTGIGLYFSKMIIEGNMNGKLYAENTDEGACFIISVPTAKNGG